MSDLKDNPKRIKETIRFNYTQLTAIEEYLSQQEEKGLRLVEIEKEKFIFEQAPERKIRYAAEIYKSNSLKEDFIAACEEDGWEYVDSYYNELYIFRTHNSYAGDIMTDEKEKFKTVAKSVLFQPGYLGFSGLVLFLFFEVFVLRTEFDGIIEMNIRDCIDVMIIVYHAIYTLVKLASFAAWYFKSKKRIKENEKIPFSNLKRADKMNIVWSALSSLYSVVLFGTYVFLEFGYTDSIWFFWFLGAILCAEIIFFICELKILNKKGNRVIKYAVSIIAAAVIIIGVYATAEYSKQAYIQNFNSMLNYEEIPVSLSDFGLDRENCVDETVNVSATKLGQHYIFNSEYDFQEEKYEDHYIRYKVFVSDYPQVIEHYINFLKEKYDDYDIALIKVEEPNNWDELYLESHDGEISQLGYAIKDNTVIVLDRYGTSKENIFFEIAYKNLFPDK